MGAITRPKRPKKAKKGSSGRAKGRKTARRVTVVKGS